MDPDRGERLAENNSGLPRITRINANENLGHETICASRGLPAIPCLLIRVDSRDSWEIFVVLDSFGHSDDPTADRLGRSLGAIVDVEFFEDVADMTLHGVL